MNEISALSFLYFSTKKRYSFRDFSILSSPKLGPKSFQEQWFSFLLCWVSLLCSPSFVPVEREHQWCWPSTLMDEEGIRHNLLHQLLLCTGCNWAVFQEGHEVGILHTWDRAAITGQGNPLTLLSESPLSCSALYVSDKKRHEFTFLGVCSTS